MIFKAGLSVNYARTRVSRLVAKSKSVSNHGIAIKPRGQTTGQFMTDKQDKRKRPSRNRQGSKRTETEVKRTLQQQANLDLRPKYGADFEPIPEIGIVERGQKLMTGYIVLQQSHDVLCNKYSIDPCLEHPVPEGQT